MAADRTHRLSAALRLNPSVGYRGLGPEIVACAWIVFGVVLWTGSDMPRVVLPALIALGMAIGEVREARKRRRPNSRLVDARST
jgi:hypothetical protein